MREPKPLDANGLYAIWRGMVSRCTNSNNTSYRRYGGRGITVCDQWLIDFTRFAIDMGPRPSHEYSIDRIDNDGPYSPANCRWATSEEQANNRSTSIFLTFEGIRKPLRDWANALGVPERKILARVKDGWPDELLLSVPFS